MKNGLSCAFLRDAAGFLKISLYRPFIYYLKSSFARKSQMWWYGRWNSDAAHGCRKKKKLICGPEGEIVVAHMAACLPPLERKFLNAKMGNNVVLNYIIFWGIFNRFSVMQQYPTLTTTVEFWTFFDLFHQTKK